MTKIYTLTLAPSLDSATQTPQIYPEGKLRCSAPVFEPGGGGINVARAVTFLGGKATAIFPVGGATGEHLAALLADEQVPVETVETRDWTRQNLHVHVAASGEQYRFVMPGAALTDDEFRRLEEKVLTIEPGSLLVVSGSLPPGISVDNLMQLVKNAQQQGLRCIIDSSGDALAAALDESGQRKLLDEMELPLARVLADMERIGFAVDADGIRAFGDSLRGELDGILQNIYTEVGYEFNVNSPKQLGEALFDKLGLPPRKKTARGYSTDAETLESLRAYSPAVDDILKYRTYSKLLSTYVEGLLKALGPDGRIHSTFIQTEARTGRISSTEPNLQNIPIRTELGSRLRGYFVAAPGETLVDADYSQIELRILAHITGDEAMQQAFLSGADIHRATAAKIYHIPESDVTHELRTSAKAINFGIMYGKGAFSLGKDLGISVKEADTFLKTYLNTFPKVDGYMQNCIEHAKEKGYVETLFGRRRPLPELASSNFQVRSSGERMARNTPIQGTAADIIKLAMVHVWQRLRDEKLQARLLLQVHDELIVEAPENEVEQVKRILKEEMEQVVSYSVPLTAEVGTGKTWLEAH